MTKNSNSIILKFNQVGEQTYGPVKRYIGTVQSRHIVDLISLVNLGANPRLSKVSNITSAIEESIENTPDIFPVKSKGILVGVTYYKLLERNRLQLIIEDDDTEGVLDGGHNMLAIGRYILRQVGLSNKDLNKAKNWIQFKQIWSQNLDKIRDIKDEVDFLVPIEIITPLSQDEADIQEFKGIILDICSARNTNIQLPANATQNQSGLYDVLKKSLDSKISKEVEWKPNDGNRIKSQTIIALAWPLLLALDDETLPQISPYQIYSSKGKCVEVYERFMKDKRVSEQVEGDVERYRCINTKVISVLSLLKDMPRLYDKILENFPEAYNAEAGSYGRISEVGFYDENRAGKPGYNGLKTAPRTLFYQTKIKYNNPDGYIWPIIYGLTALIQFNGETAKWKDSPDKYVSVAALRSFLRVYKGMIEFAKWDPQKVGKSSACYEMAIREFSRM